MNPTEKLPLSKNDHHQIKKSDLKPACPNSLADSSLLIKKEDNLTSRSAEPQNFPNSKIKSISISDNTDKPLKVDSQEHLEINRDNIPVSEKSFKAPVASTVRELLCKGSIPLSYTSSLFTQTLVSQSSTVETKPALSVVTSLPSSSSWITEINKNQNITLTSPRILPPGTKILDIKRPAKHSHKGSKKTQSKNFTVLQNNDTSSLKRNTNLQNKIIDQNSYTDNEKSAAEDLISLKDGLGMSGSESFSPCAPFSSPQIFPKSADEKNKEHSYCNDRTVQPHFGSSSSINLVNNTELVSSQIINGSNCVNTYNIRTGAITSSKISDSASQAIPSKHSLLVGGGSKGHISKRYTTVDKSSVPPIVSTLNLYGVSNSKHKSTESFSQPNNKLRCIESKNDFKNFASNVVMPQTSTVSILPQPTQVIIGQNSNFIVSSSHTHHQQPISAGGDYSDHLMRAAALSKEDKAMTSSSNVTASQTNGMHTSLHRLLAQQRVITAPVLLSSKPSEVGPSAVVNSAAGIPHKNLTTISKNQLKILPQVDNKGKLNIFFSIVEIVFRVHSCRFRGNC